MYFLFHNCSGISYLMIVNKSWSFPDLFFFPLYFCLPITGTLKSSLLTSYPKSLGSSFCRTYNDCLVEALVAEAEKEKEIVVVHAGMGTDPSLQLFRSTFPERFFDVGMAEQHAVTFAAGLACGGLKPFCIIPSTFLQRAFDQVLFARSFLPSVLHPV